MLSARISSYIAIALLLTLTVSVCAQAANHIPTPQQLSAKKKFEEAVRNFDLTPGFLNKLEAYKDEVGKDPCKYYAGFNQKKFANIKSMSQWTSAYDSMPGVHAALARHGLTARQMLLGSYVLSSAMMHDLAKAHPDMVEKGVISGGDDMPVSKENLAFYEQHKAEIRKRQKQRGRAMYQRMKKNPEIMSCMRNQFQQD